MNAEVEFWLLLLALFGLVLLCVKPLGSYMANVMEGRPSFALARGRRRRRACYIADAGSIPRGDVLEQDTQSRLLLFNTLGRSIVYALQRLQDFLPFNPQNLAAVRPDSSFNTAVSFVTNTNWQGYSGESTMGYLVQMAGLAVQNFLSAATGIAVAIALIRGFARHTCQRDR